jgi:hypothetical protein
MSDGIVMQLKAQRLPRAETRVHEGAEWSAYVPKSGALSVREDLLEQCCCIDAL